MSETDERRGFLWDRLRLKKRRELDRLQRDLVKRPGEKRQFAGDPQQPRYLWVKTRNK